MEHNIFGLLLLISVLNASIWELTYGGCYPDLDIVCFDREKQQ